jgi:hypothetical protein
MLYTYPSRCGRGLRSLTVWFVNKSAGRPPVLSKLSLEQRNDLFRYFYEHGKHCAAGFSKHEAFKAYNRYSLRMVAECFGVNTSNLKRNVGRSPLYQAYVAAFAVSDEGSKFRWHDQSAQVMDNRSVNQNITQQEFERELHFQPIHLSISMISSASVARGACARAHIRYARACAFPCSCVHLCRRRARRRSARHRRACRHRACRR